jgi:hypothetical protein
MVYKMNEIKNVFIYVLDDFEEPVKLYIGDYVSLTCFGINLVDAISGIVNTPFSFINKKLIIQIIHSIKIFIECKKVDLQMSDSDFKICYDIDKSFLNNTKDLSFKVKEVETFLSKYADKNIKLYISWD